MAHGWRSTQDLRANAVDLVSNVHVIYLISLDSTADRCEFVVE